jgi:hypothetical protein
MVESNIVIEQGNAAKNLPVVQVVQDAYLADYKSKPKRAKWAMVWCFLAASITYSILILFGMLNNEIPCEEKLKDNLKKILRTLFKR